MRTGIALGSNLGNRLAHLAAARTFLHSLHNNTAPPLISPNYETLPIDCPPDSPPFLNAVMEIHTNLSPDNLLAHCASFEQSLGRPSLREKNSPRPLDLDILYIGDLIINTPALTIPHPRITERLFVLRPLADIRPDLLLPGFTLTISALLTTAELAANPAFTQNSSPTQP